MGGHCLEGKPTTATIKVSGYQLRYRKLGTGPCIVLIPPPLSDVQFYCELQYQLQEQFTTIAIDLPQVKEFNMMLSILSSGMQEIVTGEYHLLVVSASTWIVQYLIQLLKQSPESLIMINGIYSNFRYTTKYRMGLKSSKMLPNSTFKKQAKEFSQLLLKEIPTKSIYDSYFSLRINSMGKKLIREQLSWFVERRAPPQKTNLPALIIYSTKDPVFKLSEKKELLEAYTDAEVVRLDSRAHLLHVVFKSLVEERIINFVKN